MKIITAQTKRGLVLKGVFWGDSAMEKVVVIMSGICSNVFNNEIFEAAAEVLNKNNIALICGQAMDAFSLLHYTDSNLKKQVATGVVFDDFDCAYEDVETYVNTAKEMGFKEIIVAGHSLGSNKIIHYLSKTEETAVKNFIVSAPVDLAEMLNSNEEKEMYLETAQRFVDEGRGKDILPFLFMGFSPMCADTLLQFHSAQNLKNCPVLSGEGETDSLASIKIEGAFIIGEKDSMTNGDAEGFISKINSYCKEPDKNQIVVVKNASHIFYQKHNEYAEAILNCIENFTKSFDKDLTDSRYQALTC